MRKLPDCTVDTFHESNMHLPVILVIPLLLRSHITSLPGAYPSLPSLIPSV